MRSDLISTGSCGLKYVVIEVPEKLSRIVFKRVREKLTSKDHKLRGPETYGEKDDLILKLTI